ncbi:MAG: iron-containing alcohol dehydrogenase [Candidatus Hodarchaeales archaeon]|jgi:alcohol dehydrogenase class IV
MDFEFLHSPRIIFGLSQFQRIGILVKEFGSNALIVASESALEKTGAKQIIDEEFSNQDIEVTFFQVKGEPEIELVDRGADLGKESGANVVVGIGGGSAVDAGKAIAGLITNGGSTLDYMEVIGKGKKIGRPTLPYIAVPTTAGTGSEVTKNAVISARKEGFKASIRSLYLVPSLVVIDPELMVTIPQEVTARCGMDTLTQLIESYTSRNANPLTDSLAELGIKFAAKSIRVTYSTGTDIDARESMALASLLSGLCLANAGLGAVHGFASPIGAIYPIPHGSVCAALLPPTVEMNMRELKKLPDHLSLEKYARIGELLTGRTFTEADEACKATTEYLYDLSTFLKIARLSSFGIEAENFPEIIEKAKKASSMKYNPIKLSTGALQDILERAL